MCEYPNKKLVQPSTDQEYRTPDKNGAVARLAHHNSGLLSRLLNSAELLLTSRVELG